MKEDISYFSCLFWLFKIFPKKCKILEASENLKDVSWWSEGEGRQLPPSEAAAAVQTVVGEKPQVTKTIFSDNNQAFEEEREIGKDGKMMSDKCGS